MDLGRIRIVLVNTSHPGNIGAAARAMKNMGLSRLYLVAPDKFPSGVAIGRAASALDVLDGAVVVDTLQEAIADCGVVFSTSARNRHIPWPVLEPDECARRAVAAQGDNEVALVFGREARGLSNDELELCHYHVQIPTNPVYPSLNLAASVMVLCYELRKAASRIETLPEAEGGRLIEERWDRELATMEQIERYLEHLERVMVKLDFHDPKNPRRLMRRMRRLFTRIRPDRMEINILRGFMTAIEQGLEIAAGLRPDPKALKAAREERARLLRDAEDDEAV